MESKKEIQSEGDRLKTILELTFISAHKLSKLLKFKSPSSIYHVLEGRNSLSLDMMKGIINEFPKVSYPYLKTGIGEPLLQSEREINNQLKTFGILDEKKKKQSNQNKNHKQSNITMENKRQPQSDSIRLKTILELKFLNAHKLSLLLKFKSPSSIYHILEGRNSLSTDVMQKIIKIFPEVNYVYMKTGEGEPLLKTESERTNQLKTLGLLKEEKTNTTVESPKDLFSNIETNQSSSKENDPISYNVATQLQQLIDNSNRLNGLVEILIEENRKS